MARSSDSGSDLVDWGKAIVLETRGRITGSARRATIGFIDEPGATLLVSAAGEDTHWARNLLADPRCRVRLGDRWHDHTAVRLDSAEHHDAVAALILRYGTPAERLGSGPSFRLVPDRRGLPPLAAAESVDLQGPA